VRAKIVEAAWVLRWAYTHRDFYARDPKQAHSLLAVALPCAHGGIPNWGDILCSLAEGTFALVWLRPCLMGISGS